MFEDKSQIGVSYQVIKVTKSRIEKGLLAVPVSLIDKFPKHKQKISKKISIYFDNDITFELKSFLPYNTTAKESRIGGLSEWFLRNKIQDKDEIVIDFLDEQEGVYRLRKESHFINEIKQIETDLFVDTNQIKSLLQIETKLNTYAQKINLSKKDILLNLYIKMKEFPVVKRIYKQANQKQHKENVPFLMRKILEACYEGKCQISNFTFIQKNGTPYFEIHHIDANRGNDWKNLLVVSPNIHAQFTFQNHTNHFDNEGWLQEVKFEEKKFQVKQLLNKLDKKFIKTVYE